MSARSLRKHGTIVFLAALVALSGCAGMFGPGGAGTATPTATGTATTTGTATPTATTTTGTPSSNGTTAAMSGEVLVTIEGQQLHLSGESQQGSVRFGGDHTWAASEDSVTLAAALAEAGINASAGTLTYEGTTYRDSASNTTVAYIVDGTDVENPESYQLKANDEVFVVVTTPAIETPGAYVKDNHLHPHGTLNVTVKGDSIDFSSKKRAHADRFFHLHEDESTNQWHAHSTNITLEYAIKTFDGMSVTNSSVTVDNQTYRDDANTNVSITVDGEPVDPSTYVLKDGDTVRVVVTDR